MGIWGSDATGPPERVGGGELSIGGRRRTIFRSLSVLDSPASSAGLIVVFAGCGATLAERTTGTRSLPPADWLLGSALATGGAVSAGTEETVFFADLCDALSSLAAEAFFAAGGGSFGQPIGAPRSIPPAALFVVGPAVGEEGSRHTPPSHPGATRGIEAAMAGTAGAGLEIASAAVWVSRCGTAIGTGFAIAGDCAGADASGALLGCGGAVDAATILQTAGYWTTLNPTQKISVANTPSAAAILGMAHSPAFPCGRSSSRS